MHDDWLDEELHRSLGRRPEYSVPGFASVMQAAEEHNTRSKQRYRFVAAIALVVSVAAISIGQWPTASDTHDYEFLTASALLETTQWSAPSDVLLPDHQFDIYQDMPVFTGSTKHEEGTLL